MLGKGEKLIELAKDTFLSPDYTRLKPVLDRCSGELAIRFDALNSRYKFYPFSLDTLKESEGLWRDTTEFADLIPIVFKDVEKKLELICDSSRRGRLSADEAMKVVEFYRHGDLYAGLLAPVLERYDEVHSQTYGKEWGEGHRQSEEYGLKTLVRGVKQDSLLEFRKRFEEMDHKFWPEDYRENILRGVRSKHENEMDYAHLNPGR